MRLKTIRNALTVNQSDFLWPVMKSLRLWQLKYIKEIAESKNLNGLTIRTLYFRFRDWPKEAASASLANNIENPKTLILLLDTRHRRPLREK